jgi:hypothetical protein
MSDFLIDVTYDTRLDSWIASYSNGSDIALYANSYQDAVLEADLLDATEFQIA